VPIWIRRAASSSPARRQHQRIEDAQGQDQGRPVHQHPPRREQDEAERDERAGQEEEEAGRGPGPHARDARDQEEAGRGQGGQLEAAGQTRAGQERPIDDAFQQLGVELDAGHAIAHRRRRVVGETERGHPDQHEPAGESRRIDPAREHALRGHEAIRPTAAEVDPHAGVALGGHRHIPHRDRLDAAGLRSHRQRRHARGHPEHLDAERGSERAADRDEQRHAPHHATLRIHADDPAPRRGRVDLVHAAQQALEAANERLGIIPECAHRREAAAGRPVRIRLLETGHPEHHASVEKGPREQRVGGRHRRERLGEGGIDLLHQPGQAPGRETVGLGHQDGEADGGGPRLGDAAHQPGEPAARPGPLAVDPQAVLVDGDDDDRFRARHARHRALIRIEAGEAKQAGARHVGEHHHEQQGQQQEAERLAAASAERAGPLALDPVRALRRNRAQIDGLRARSPDRRRRPGPPPGDRSA
jgi:hypothetical protein